MAGKLEVWGNAAADATDIVTVNGREIIAVKVAMDRKGKNGEKIGPDYISVLVYANGAREKFDVARKVRKGDYVAAKGTMSTPEISDDGRYVNYHINVSDLDVFSYISRKAHASRPEAKAVAGAEGYPY